MDDLLSLKNEIESLKEIINQINAEKTAIDQVCLANIKENITLRAKAILLESELNVSNNKNHELILKLKDKENLVDLKEVCA